MSIVGHFINGQHVADDQRTQEVFDPAQGAVTKHVALASKYTVASAIAAAETAFPAWRQTPPAKRAHHVPLQAAARRGRRKAVRAHHRRARQGAQRRVG